MVLREALKHRREAARQIADLVCGIGARGKAPDPAAAIDCRLGLVAQRRGDSSLASRSLRNAARCALSSDSGAWWTREIAPAELEARVKAAITSFQEDSL